MEKVTNRVPRQYIGKNTVVLIIKQKAVFFWSLGSSGEVYT